MQDNSFIDTCYGPVAQYVFERARHVRLLICDMDGVMSDGLIYMGNNGETLKTFNMRDGYGIRCLLTSGVEVAIITGSFSRLTEDRCKTLGIRYLYQKQSDKTLSFKALLNKLKLTTNQVAYIGDDLIDAPVIDQVGLSVAVANAHPLLRSRSNYITRMAGGHGAVREICDLLLQAQGKLKTTKGKLV
ncbi:MAG: 3-deoxy-D-manno-octulosonate 8-phosphate phosphatase KdsC [Sodalis sp. Fle]|nr:MAG: 3-deoxy-D-manno-octulosonate 8-phosphate phosphatase KdsC [Sodalis sp. Fle]